MASLSKTASLVIRTATQDTVNICRKSFLCFEMDEIHQYITCNDPNDVLNHALIEYEKAVYELPSVVMEEGESYLIKQPPLDEAKVCLLEEKINELLKNNKVIQDLAELHTDALGIAVDTANDNFDRCELFNAHMRYMESTLATLKRIVEAHM